MALPPPHSCYVILTFVGLTVGCGIIGGSIALATATWECTTYKGRNCVKDEDTCTESTPCYCPGTGHSSYYYTDEVCTDEDLKWSSGEDSLLILFLCLFWIFLIASIVCCCCRCCHADQYASSTQYIVVAPGPYPQGGPQYVPSALGSYPQGGPQYVPTALGSYPQGGPQYVPSAPEPYPKGGKV